MILDTVPRSQDSRWPAEVVASAAGHQAALSAPSNSMSYYLTGYAGYSASAQTMTLLRRSTKKITGATTEVTIPDDALIQFATGDFGFSFWVKTSDVSSLVIQKGDPASTEGYEITVTDAGKIKLTVKDGDAKTFTKTGDTAINDGLWHHICITVVVGSPLIDGAWIYVDGVKDHAAAGASTGLTGNVSASGTDLTIVATAGKTCYLSTLGIYKAGLPTAATEWNEGVGRRLTSSDTYLSAGYQLNEGDGTSAYDVKGVLEGVYTTDAVTAWAVGGPPVDDRDENSALNTIQEVFRLSATPTFVTFPHAIKIGRAAPLAVSLSGASTVRLFGFCDHY